jgi:hypothetical protein
VNCTVASAGEDDLVPGGGSSSQIGGISGAGGLRGLDLDAVIPQGFDELENRLCEISPSPGPGIEDQRRSPH